LISRVLFFSSKLEVNPFVVSSAAEFE